MRFVSMGHHRLDDATQSLVVRNRLVEIRELRKKLTK